MFALSVPFFLFPSFFLSFFLSLTFYLFTFRAEGREKERERNISVWLPLAHPIPATWPATQACALDWESNWRPFGSQAGAQSVEPHQPGLFLYFRVSLFSELLRSKSIYTLKKISISKKYGYFLL